MAWGIPALADGPKSVVFHDGGTADSAEKTLLHAALESENGDFGRGNFDLDGNFSNGQPGNEDTAEHER